MKAYCLGVTRMRGVGRTSKQAYDMGKLIVMNAVRPFSKEGLEISGYGYEPAEVALAPDALEKFAHVKFPALLDLETDMETRGGKLQPIVTGLREVKAA